MWARGDNIWQGCIIRSKVQLEIQSKVSRINQLFLADSCLLSFNCEYVLPMKSAKSQHYAHNRSSSLRVLDNGKRKVHLLHCLAITQGKVTTSAGHALKLIVPKRELVFCLQNPSTIALLLSVHQASQLQLQRLRTHLASVALTMVRYLPYS